MRIEQATEADTETIAELLAEKEAYYGGPATPGDLAQIRGALFGQQPAATVLLASEDGEVLGMACYTWMWPAVGAGTSLYLKDLFVRESARRRGLGSAFMRRLQEVAAERGCSRIEWTADLNNPPATTFYAKLGVERNSEKIFYRLTLPTA